jgi:predicted dehydrogenase
MTKKKLNVGLVGFKFMGKMHSHAFKDIGMFLDSPADVAMKVLCGAPEEEKDLKEAARVMGWEEYTTSWEELVKRKDIDLIDIAAPNFLHKQIAVAAAKEGKHILGEKPLALNIKEAREMLDAVRKAKVKHMTGFSYRWTPAIILVKKMIEEGRLGEIFHFRSHYLQDWIVDPNFPLVWRLKKELTGSGALGDLGAHHIDLARFLIGEIEEIVATEKTFIKERPIPGSTKGEKGKVTVDDAALILARFKNGIIGSIEATRFASGRRSYNSFEINGSKGSVYFNFEDMNRLKYFSREDKEDVQGFRDILVTDAVHPYMKYWWPSGHIIGYEHTFVHQLNELIEAIVEDRMPKPDFSEGVKCQEILEAVEQSAVDKKWVKI